MMRETLSRIWAVLRQPINPVKLDWFLFGDGRGMGEPFFDGEIYWLVDTWSSREIGRGNFYRRFSGLGAQLVSIEWSAPLPGTRRTLKGIEVVVHSVTRRFPRTMVFWSRCPPVNNYSEVAEFHSKMRSYP